MIRNGDTDILKTIVEHRLLTAPQITHLRSSSDQMTRRRTRQLIKGKLIETARRTLGQARGRPENVYSVTREGVDYLRNEGVLAKSIPYDQATGEKIRCVEHQLLVNWTRIHLSHMEKVCPSLTVQFFSPVSPFRLDDDGRSLVSDCVPGVDGAETVKFTSGWRFFDHAQGHACQPSVLPRGGYVNRVACQSERRFAGHPPEDHQLPDVPRHRPVQTVWGIVRG